MKIVKLENIQLKDDKEEITEEYVCEGCRHLIQPADKSCWQCGQPLEPSSEVEHYHQGEKLTKEQFGERSKSYGH